MGTQTAFLFPGQGSQAVGMLDAFADTTVRETLAEASDALSFDFWSLIHGGPVEQLNETAYTQPVLLAADVALWRYFEKDCQKPQWLAGHSLGEYAALVCADALAFDDALRLVQKRGQLMQSAAPLGTTAMAAIIGLSDEVVQALCEAVAVDDAHYVAAANFNAPGQVVVAGRMAGVDALMLQAKENKAKLAKKIPISVPSHCELMKSIATELTEAIAAVDIRQPSIPVVHNVDAKPHADVNAIRQVLAEQVYSPVYWSQTVAYLVDQGVDQFIECGPGKVLTGLNKRMAPDATTYPIHQQPNT